MFGRRNGEEPEPGGWNDEGVWGDENNVHMIDHPYCNDLACWCHVDVAYHDRVTDALPVVTGEQVEQARRFFGIF